MSRFIKLTKKVINTSKIVTIDILPTKYTMVMCNHHFDGWLLFTSGSVNTFENKIEICKTEHPKDYQIVKEWINQMNKELF